MFVVEIYAAVRKFVFIEGHSRREAARVFGLNRETVLKMCRFSLPPGYTRTKPPEKPKLGPLLPVIDAILEADRDAPMKQRHSAKRIFERLRDEHGFVGGYTVVKDHVRVCRARGRETFVPLSHPPGHGQVDFGEALAVIGGVRQKIHFFCLDLPQSDACFVKAYPRETTEAFLDGHVSGFAFFGGVPLSVLYDNTKIAVARICGDGKRDRTRAFTELVSHCLFQDRFGRPGKGNDKGKVEGLVKYARANFMTPIPTAASFDALNAMLADRCRARQDEHAGRHATTIGERLVADLEALRALPAVPLEPCEKRAARVSSTALVRYRCNDYSVPTAYGFQEVLVKGFVDEVAILCAGREIARHPRHYGEGVFVADPLHYLGADRDEAERARSGRGAAGLEPAGSVPAPAPSSRSQNRQSRQAGVHPGAAVDGGGSPGCRCLCRHRGHPAWGHRLRRRQADHAGADRAASPSASTSPPIPTCHNSPSGRRSRPTMRR